MYKKMMDVVLLWTCIFLKKKSNKKKGQMSQLLAIFFCMISMEQFLSSRNNLSYKWTSFSQMEKYIITILSFWQSELKCILLVLNCPFNIQTIMIFHNFCTLCIPWLCLGKVAWNCVGPKLIALSKIENPVCSFDGKKK